jgi:hypothetical protein
MSDIQRAGDCGGLRIARTAATLVLALALFGLAPHGNAAQAQGTWRFAVTGDSRNCGDVVMPAIAAQVLTLQPAFFWHLGDFRWVSNFDQDVQHQTERVATPMTIADYENRAWDDFIANQVAPFGSLPVFLGIGNHETAPPKTREQFLLQFADWLDTPVLQRQRLKDDPADHRLKAYYHWIDRGVDFIVLDNATTDQFDATQLAWFQRILARDESDPSIQALVVGVHKALPESIAVGHSMNESPSGTESGRTVYKALLQMRDKAGKHVYVLASHDHYYMDGIFKTDYWRANGGVLPGWIVGTGGAERYALPEHASDARTAQTRIYGFLVGTVNPGGDIQFEFRPVQETDVPATVATRYGSEFVHWCFAENARPDAK